MMANQGIVEAFAGRFEIIFALPLFSLVLLRIPVRKESLLWNISKHIIVVMGAEIVKVDKISLKPVGVHAKSFHPHVSFRRPSSVLRKGAFSDISLHELQYGHTIAKMLLLVNHVTVYLRTDVSLR